MSAALEQLVRRKLARGPLYLRSFQQVKPIVERMIVRGEIKRVAPVGQRAKNMVELTEQGRAELEARCL